MKCNNSNNINLIKLLEKSIFLSKGTRIEKIKKSPIKLPISKIVELFSQWSDKPLTIKAKTFWNENMRVVIPELVSLCIYRYGFFEEDLTRMVLKYLKPGMTFFDIGAHFGFFTLFGSFLVGYEGQVHSFEPTLSSFNVLKTNVLNKGNVILNDCAVFSKRKTILINDYGIQYSAFNSIYSARLPQDIISKLKLQKYEIKTISIDEYVESKGIRPDFIKIDAESSEFEILLGMEETITKFQPMISVEVGDIGVNDVPTSKDLIDFLINRGYQPYEFIGDRIIKHAIKNEYNYKNIIFVPN
jgi:FkbM family methyltransferase